MSVSILIGDCRERMKELADASVDSVVCDPPYHLTSIVKRFGSPTAAPAKVGQTGAYARHSTGFMGQKWDGGDIAQDPAMWAEVLRVLKPGGHLVAFSGTRTYHRMAVAIEDAGFEIRDQLAWVYGSGFPKSLDVSKAIDKAAHSIPLFDTIRAHIREWKDKRGLDNRALNVAVGSATNGCGMARHWTSIEGGQHMIPSKDQWRNLKRVLDWPDCELDAIYDAVKDGAERPKVGEAIGAQAESTGRYGAWGKDGGDGRSVYDITAPATQAAQQWQGWGTSLKPCWEPICLARKPLSGTVANNVLRYGTGAINVDACRISSVTGQLPSEDGAWEDDQSLCVSCAEVVESQARSGIPATRESIATRSAEPTSSAKAGTLLDAISRTDTGCSAGTKAGDNAISLSTAASGKTPTARSPQDTTSTISITTEATTESRTCPSCGTSIIAPITGSNTTRGKSGSQRDEKQPVDTALGRWPGNLCHDGSDEVLAGFPAEAGGKGGHEVRRTADRFQGVYSATEGNSNTTNGHADSGSAARFFYCAKATSEERGEGNDHPTVKPIALMRWLCRLVTPPGGTILDPFMGSGSTLIAADAEQFHAIGCELSPEYAAIAERRVRDAAGMFADVKVAA